MVTFNFFVLCSKLKEYALQRFEQMELDSTDFETYWNGLQSSPQCRKSMLNSLSGLLNSELPQVMMNQRSTFDILSQVVMFTAYLNCIHDGEYRAAFLLLAEWSLATSKLPKRA